MSKSFSDRLAKDPAYFPKETQPELFPTQNAGPYAL